jgi:hypothetical protein
MKTRRSLWGVLTIALAVAVGAGAAEKKWTLSEWLKDLDSKIRRVQDKHKNQKVAVAAVRGDKAKPTTKLYWKGEKGEVSDAEIADFKAAVDLAQTGKPDEARAALDAFLAKYPATAMKADATSLAMAMSKTSASTSRRSGLTISNRVSRASSTCPETTLAEAMTPLTGATNCSSSTRRPETSIGRPPARTPFG